MQMRCSTTFLTEVMHDDALRDADEGVRKGEVDACVSALRDGHVVHPRRHLATHYGPEDLSLRSHPGVFDPHMTQGRPRHLPPTRRFKLFKTAGALDAYLLQGDFKRL